MGVEHVCQGQGTIYHLHFNPLQYLLFSTFHLKWV